MYLFISFTMYFFAILCYNKTLGLFLPGGNFFPGKTWKVFQLVKTTAATWPQALISPPTID
ncbi:hypothetical protein CBD41_08730 [bacterium TMED181]|nr:MAG: hypothetical protein CBD41_08730 [bacterium TMED181]